SDIFQTQNNMKFASFEQSGVSWHNSPERDRRADLGAAPWMPGVLPKKVCNFHIGEQSNGFLPFFLDKITSME
ncbi:MAG: hypothetical protein Q3X00_01450, partial [Oscillospiraceae bacterium]|nr:hypothetical protein [Oscillospiraceae bacterium]